MLYLPQIELLSQKLVNYQKKYSSAERLHSSNISLQHKMTNMKQENKTSYAFIRSSTIDVTDSNKCAVPKDEFRIIDFSNAVGAQFKDLVHNVKPFLHFQILQPINQDQREKAINYFFLGYEHSQFIGYQNPISWECFPMPKKKRLRRNGGHDINIITLPQNGVHI